MHSPRRRIAVAFAALAAVATALLAPAAAVAAPAAITIAWSDARLETVFGGAVQSSLRIPQIGELCADAFACRIELSARGGSFAPPQPDAIVAEPAGDGIASWSLEGGTALLPAGTHLLDAALTLPDGAVVRTTEPLEIEVDPNRLEVAVSVAEDAGDRSGAVISAQLGGDYLQYVNPYHVAVPLRTPAGTWSVSVVDASGETVFEQQRTVAAGGPIATSWYWQGVPVASEVTASASFELAGEAAGNVTVEQPASATFTASEAEAAPVVEITPTPVAEPTVGDSVAVPTGIVAIAGLVAALLLVVAIVLAVRLERRIARVDGSPEAAPRG